MSHVTHRSAERLTPEQAADLVRRARLIRPTRDGVSVMMFARDALNAIEREWGESLGEDRIGELRATLEAIRALRSQ